MVDVASGIVDDVGREVRLQWARGAQLLQCCYQPAVLVSGQGAQSPGHLVAILVIRPTARGALLLAVASGPDDGDGCSCY